MSRAPASRSTGSGGGVAQVCLGVVSGVCDGGAGSPGARGGDFLEWHPWHRQRPLQVTLQILCFKLHFYENFSEKPCHRSHKKQKVDTTHSPTLSPQRSVAG